MRTARIKIPSDEGTAVYHCISRTVNGERLFDETAREMFRRQMWQVAEYCGVQIITYAILSNHFHILVLVPRATTVNDAELLRRYKLLYPQPTKFQVARLDVLEKKLAADDDDMHVWRKQQLALMGDVSQFMKLLKQRFSVWFNQTHGRFGTLWSERFKSVLVENGPALRAMAAYIDLNPVRAGLAADPKDYRFCGYAEAVAGGKKLRASLSAALEHTDWRTAHNSYRQMLHGGKNKRGAASLSATQIEKVRAAQGALSTAEWLRCRLRYFTDGAVLGSQAFVTAQLARYRQRTGRRKHTAPRPLPVVGDLGELAVLRGQRQRHAGQP
ncbi:MAG: transposase [Verrucomicrobiales bacterium]|jgi:REP element-mobilizing transposase RayT|nr:transposase [Verrucomicrobiales bacterium]